MAPEVLKHITFHMSVLIIKKGGVLGFGGAVLLLALLFVSLGEGLYRLGERPWLSMISDYW